MNVATGADTFTVSRPGSGGLTLIPAGNQWLVALSSSGLYVFDARDGRQVASTSMTSLRAGAVSRDGTTVVLVDRARAVHLCHMASECRDLKARRSRAVRFR